MLLYWGRNLVKSDQTRPPPRSNPEGAIYIIHNSRAWLQCTLNPAFLSWSRVHIFWSQDDTSCVEIKHSNCGSRIFSTSYRSLMSFKRLDTPWTALYVVWCLSTPWTALFVVWCLGTPWTALYVVWCLGTPWTALYVVWCPGTPWTALCVLKHSNQSWKSCHDMAGCASV